MDEHEAFAFFCFIVLTVFAYVFLNVVLELFILYFRAVTVFNLWLDVKEIEFKEMKWQDK